MRHHQTPHSSLASDRHLGAKTIQHLRQYLLLLCRLNECSTARSPTPPIRQARTTKTAAPSRSATRPSPRSSRTDVTTRRPWRYLLQPVKHSNMRRKSHLPLQTHATRRALCRNLTLPSAQQAEFPAARTTQQQHRYHPLQCEHSNCQSKRQIPPAQRRHRAQLTVQQPNLQPTHHVSHPRLQTRSLTTPCGCMHWARVTPHTCASTVNGATPTQYNDWYD